MRIPQCSKTGEGLNTPRKININPENDGLEDDFPFQGCILRFHVNLPGCITKKRTSSQWVDFQSDILGESKHMP